MGVRFDSISFLGLLVFIMFQKDICSNAFFESPSWHTSDQRRSDGTSFDRLMMLTFDGVRSGRGTEPTPSSVP